MKSLATALLMLVPASCCLAQLDQSSREEAEYYVAAYARHYRIPLEFVRALVEQESGWHSCVISSKGAVGLMQLMPVTAQRLGVRDRCNPDQNVSGGVRYLAWLMQQLHNDLRLVAAAYYAGEDVIIRRGLLCRNPDIVAYVSAIRSEYQREMASERGVHADVNGDVR